MPSIYVPGNTRRSPFLDIRRGVNQWCNPQDESFEPTGSYYEVDITLYVNSCETDVSTVTLAATACFCHQDKLAATQ